MHYHKEIDGLRAIAVLSVVFYHYGAIWVPGGFVGVDVFFVISGYLITRQLNQSIANNGLSILDFYNRRIRRIFPVMLLVLTASLWVGWFILLPGDYSDLGKSVAYSAFGAGNFYFYWHIGYFDRQADMLPLLHMWSLGVEEQFYVVWPAILALLLKLTGHRPRQMIVAIIAIAGISLFTTAITVPVDPNAAFYLPQFRAWELALGALLVYAPAIQKQSTAEITTLSGLALIAYSILRLTSSDQFPGLNAVPPCLGAALVIWPKAPPTQLNRLLSTGPIRLTGLISYSFYLWHWPILVFYKHYANGLMPTLWQAIFLGLSAYLCGWLSWYYVEGPFRRLKLRPHWLIGSGSAASLIVCVWFSV